ncbi:hypothetical protein DRJ48_05190 [Candidatus Woesearchaeota archaeon]|nr:MAG: hypothetical protein DRJ48_05190 [Candidatus Woesearchaeota archaeon]
MKPQKLYMCIVLLLIGLGLALNLRINHHEPNHSKPNIILFTFDALRADHLGIYGYDKNTSPNIDDLAKNSYVFTNSFSQCGSTACSLPSLHTSLFPLEPKSNATTIARFLKSQGYNTIGVIAVRFANSTYVNKDGFDIYDENFTFWENSSVTVNRALSILDQAKQPFFLWVHVRQPHGPYNPRKEIFLEMYPHNDEPTFYSDIPNLDWSGLQEYLLEYYTNKGEIEEKYATMRRFPGLITPTMLAQIIAMYDGNIKEADISFGGFLKYLKSKRLLDNTIIIVSADHGESLGEHNIIDHNNLYYVTLHTPLIVHFPSNEHKVIGYPVMNVDIFPTIISLLNISTNFTLKGKNLFDSNRTDYFQYAEYSNERWTIKYGAYKLIHKNNESMLFNVEEDPAEQHNLLVLNPKQYSNLTNMFIGLHDNLSRDRETTNFNILAKLRALGYI